jgi:squalene-hopene/tetraprenyl-beta-curcumene cyclase
MMPIAAQSDTPKYEWQPAAPVDHSIDAATRALLALQKADGHWVFELEADATIPAEYVLLRHYLAEPVDAAL